MLIRFYHILDLQRVLEGSPWTFGNHPIIIHRLKVGEVPLQVPLDKIAFWVQIHNLPVGSFLEKIGNMLGNFIGRFLEYDDTNEGAI